MNAMYSNTMGVPQSLDGAKSYVVDEAHFSEQECNITADDKLTGCCPVQLKEGFDFDVDICNLGHTIATDSVIVDNVYSVCDAGSTCSSKVQETKVLKYQKDQATGKLSTFLYNENHQAGDSASVEIFNADSDTTHTNNDSIRITGGTAATHANKNITIATAASGADIKVEAQGAVDIKSDSADLSLESGADIKVDAQEDVELTAQKFDINSVLNVKLGNYISDHPRYYNRGSRGNTGDRKGDIRINVFPAAVQTPPNLMGALYVCVEDFVPNSGKPIWGSTLLYSW